MLPLETPLNALKQNAAKVPNAASDRKYKRVDRAAAYSLPDRCVLVSRQEVHAFRILLNKNDHVHPEWPGGQLAAWG